MRCAPEATRACRQFQKIGVDVLLNDGDVLEVASSQR